MTDLISITVTFPDLASAEAVTSALVDARQVACGNILPEIRSFYVWQGETRETGEVMVLYKTRREMFDVVQQTVHRLHPYEVPCIAAVPVVAASEPYRLWVNQSTQSAVK